MFSDLLITHSDVFLSHAQRLHNLSLASDYWSLRLMGKFLHLKV